MKKQESIDGLVKEIKHLSKILLTSHNKDKLTKAFSRIKCLVTGNCICDMCPTWDKNIYVVYEFGRCLVPSRLFQLIKETHYKTKRWEYILPLYRDLYDTIYEDINPDTGIIHSSGNMEDQPCFL